MTQRLNRAKCKNCGNVIVSRHHYDFQRCKCGAIFVDGGNDYWRCGGKLSNLLRYQNRKWVPMSLEREVIPPLKKSFLETFLDGCFIPFKKILDFIETLIRKVR